MHDAPHLLAWQPSGSIRDWRRPRMLLLLLPDTRTFPTSTVALIFRAIPLEQSCLALRRHFPGQIGHPATFFLIDVLRHSALDMIKLFLPLVGTRRQVLQLGQLDLGHRVLFIGHTGMCFAALVGEIATGQPSRKAAALRVVAVRRVPEEAGRQEPKCCAQGPRCLLRQSSDRRSGGSHRRRSCRLDPPRLANRARKTWSARCEGIG